MNLNAIAGNVINAVNEDIPAILYQNIGYQTLANSHRVAKYANGVAALVQVQSASSGDLRKLEGMNIQGVDTTVYMNGALSANVRVLAKGNDLIKFRNQCWLVVAVLERWPDWAKLAVTLQNDPIDLPNS